ncbi:acid sphingomyelinase-like phosphodiesterase 3b [Choristoneura fumiferana]|uniref:acid sphingomyelinase-like phosphodiesterase 3b n=1 Tax=Choristoneura fumiferana TaxID=7141 RepID=UPI003D159B97
MATAPLLLALTCAVGFSCTHAKIGYFWHITDFHYDPLYSSTGDTRRQCRRADERGSSGHHRALGRYGDYACHSSHALVESAARHMRARHAENVEFVLWTGDIIAARYGDARARFSAVRNMTDLLGRTFSSHFVFPVLGHLDPPPSDNLTALWGHWLPLEALDTFKTGGYYTIEQSHSKLRIVALNTNLFGGARDAAARAQWAWLDAVLDKAADNSEMVYIVGHALPGADARAHDASAAAANAQYLRTVRKHARCIAGQFFGHLHADTFRVIYDNDRAVSWALLAPSVSPHRDPGGSSNPGLRLYKFDTNSGKVLDYTQYYLDLAAANRLGAAEWTPEYNLTQHYALPDVSAAALHALADRLRIGTPQETATFNKYVRAYSVRHSEAECDGACAHQHYCAVTCVEPAAYRQCVEAAASALAAAGRAARAHLVFAAPMVLLSMLLLTLFDLPQTV